MMRTTWRHLATSKGKARRGGRAAAERAAIAVVAVTVVAIGKGCARREGASIRARTARLTATRATEPVASARHGRHIANARSTRHGKRVVAARSGRAGTTVVGTARELNRSDDRVSAGDGACTVLVMRVVTVMILLGESAVVASAALVVATVGAKLAFSRAMRRGRIAVHPFGHDELAELRDLSIFFLNRLVHSCVNGK